MKRLLLLGLSSLLGLMSAQVHAEIRLIDASGQSLVLKQPAQRIVSLAPNITENLYAAGAGGQLVGAVEYSDYPEAAKKLPRVGGYSRLNLEAVVALKPDLVIGWVGGNSAAHLERLRQLGLSVFLIQPERIEQIADTLEQFGQLAGTENIANAAAEKFRNRVQRLREHHAGKSAVRTFYQVWPQPLQTIGGQQIISDVIKLCGGENVFARLAALSPTVSVEAVLAAQPEAIVISLMSPTPPPGWADTWRPWKQLPAVARDNLFFISSDLIQRSTVRLLDGADQLCQQLETARSRRQARVMGRAGRAFGPKE